jgi:hypothetical protein
MVKVIPRSGRIAAVLLGAMLVGASTLAGGAAAAAASTGHGSAGHNPRAQTQALLRRGDPGGFPIPGHAWPRPVPGWPASGRSGHDFVLPAGVPAVPSPGTYSALNGIFCPSATNCWAVGSYRTAQLASLDEALHWNGSKWAQVATPNPGGTGNGDFSELFGGRCTAPGNCWAVGNYSQAGGAGIDLVLHWNGAKWSKVAAPSPGGTGTGSVNTLSDIACRSSSSCWAAGEYGLDGSGIVTIRNSVLHWNGSRWSQVTVPNPGGTENGEVNQLDSIRCPSNNDCWAVGQTQTTFTELNQALHWDGTTWTVATVPDPGGTAQYDFNDLANLACTSTVNCWAGGFYGNELGSPVELNQLLHWDGTAWTQASTPQPGGTSAGDSNLIYGVDCASASDCWAAGVYASAGAGLNQALRWDGTTWSQAVTPNPGGTASGDISELFAVHCAGATLCWAVGATSATSGTGSDEALRWNGTTWSTG